MSYKLSYPRHVKKAIDLVNIIRKNLNVLVWVVDARSPYLTTKYLKEFLEKINYEKNILIFVNKMDLVDNFDYIKFRDFLTTFDLRFPIIYGSFKNCKNLMNYLRKLANRELFLNCLFTGLPNVGKSSIINCLVGKKKTDVSVIPGTTRNLKWLSLDVNIKILDCPGIVLPIDIKKEELEELIKLGIINFHFVNIPKGKVELL